jgi:outer membrane protein assembly factor BamB
MNLTRIFVITICLTSFAAFTVPAEDWPVWGRDNSRNMYSPAKNLPQTLVAGDYKDDSEDIDMSTTENVKWVAKLGSQAYGNTTISNGKVYVGTNNETPRDPSQKGDRGIVMCFDEETGKFLWQLVVPKLGAGKVSDWEYLGICSSPCVEDNRVYIVTNRCEVVCVDTEGFTNGNDGPFKDEGSYIAGPGKPPVKPGETDADIIWRFDMREELGVFPHNIASSSVLILGDLVYVTTSNGQDWSHLNIPSPLAPCLVALNKKTGELAGEEVSGISERLMHCNWSSPAAGSVNGKEMVFFGAGDGYCYAFDPKPVMGEDDIYELKEIWRYDCVPEAYKKIKYPDPEGPSEIISTPVFYKNRVYVGIGQDPEHGDGVGNFVCIDATKKGDITEDGAIWKFNKISRTISTASIADGLVFIADYAGFVHCVDAETGKFYWTFDTQSHIWSSTLVADGKVYIGNEDGYLTVLAASKERKMLEEIDMGAPVYSTPVVANGVLYVATQTHLYAIEKGD